LARGQNCGAERIISLAREAGIEVVEDSSLAVLLDAGAQTGDIIPVWCWEAAARIIAFVQNREKAGFKAKKDRTLWKNPGISKR
jgi:flagellar biosynthesis protein